MHGFLMEADSFLTAGANRQSIHDVYCDPETPVSFHPHLR